jgi:hypothetical protein
MPEKDVQVEDQQDLENKSADEVLDIPLNDEGEPLSEEQKKKSEEDSRLKEQEAHKRNQEAAQRRIDQDKVRLKRELEEKNRRIAELEKRNPTMPSFGANQTASQFVAKDKKYWETRLAEDPVAALDEYEEHKYQQRLKQQQEASERQTLVDSFYKSLEESKELAIEEFPELKDESSEHFGMFMNILDKHPEWRNSPIGPVKVVNEMKKMLKNESGNSILNKAKSDGANEERERQARVNSQPLASNRDTGTKKSFTLTREQLEVCKEMNIKPEDYARVAMRMNGGGVTV